MLICWLVGEIGRRAPLGLEGVRKATVDCTHFSFAFSRFSHARRAGASGEADHTFVRLIHTDISFTGIDPPNAGGTERSLSASCVYGRTPFVLSALRAIRTCLSPSHRLATPAIL